MPKLSQKPKIYDPTTGKVCSLNSLIIRLGTLEVAKRYGVSPSAVYKWSKGIHHPSLQTLSKSSKKLL